MPGDEAIDHTGKRSHGSALHELTDRSPYARARAHDCGDGAFRGPTTRDIHELHRPSTLLLGQSVGGDIRGLIRDEKCVGSDYALRKLHTPRAKAAATIEEHHWLFARYHRACTTAANCSH